MSRKSLVLIALGLFALALYVAGFKTGTLFIFILAVMVELVFWYKIMLANKQNKNNDNE